MIWLLGFIGVLLIALFVVDYLIAAPPYRGPLSDHFDGKKFQNPHPVKGRTLMDMAKWSLTGNRGLWEKQHHNGAAPEAPSQSVTNGSEVIITYVNHTTFLIQLNGFNMLTDPVWSRRVSPFSWVGPKRMRPPGIAFKDLPEIHGVLISHNHYDHLDLSTVLRLKKQFNPLFITPLGVGQFLNQHGIPDTVDLDWWDERALSERIKVTAVPAQHFSGRGVFDRDKTLWCGYMLQTPAGNIYFAGDTAYGQFFTDIGRRFAPIDLALIPIGAYKPRWFMQSIHTNPEEAVHIHRDVNARQSVATHFGTFPLADEAMHEPKQDLEKARQKQGVPEDDFVVLQEGEPTLFDLQPSLNPTSA